MWKYFSQQTGRLTNLRPTDKSDSYTSTPKLGLRGIYIKTCITTKGRPVTRRKEQGCPRVSYKCTFLVTHPATRCADK